MTPREQGCELGLVYNEQSQSCDSPKNVPEWYGFFKKNILNYKVLLYTYLYIYIYILIYSKDYYAFLEDDEAKEPLTAAQIRGN